MLDIRIDALPTPELEFGGTGYYIDPRQGLIDAGPFDLRFGQAHRAQIRVAIVGPASMIADAAIWFGKCKARIESNNEFNSFPGFDRIFRSELVVMTDVAGRIERQKLDLALAQSNPQRFEAVVQLYSTAIDQAKKELLPNVVVCCIPEDVERSCWSIEHRLSQTERLKLQAKLKQETDRQLQLPFDWEPEEAVEDLLSRDLRRAIKARAMQLGIPVQLIRTNTIAELRTNEEAAVRAWNLCVGLYYKGGGIPWRIRNDGPETCFVGVTFHHLRTTHRALVFSALAQAFSSNGEGFALKGQVIEPDGNSRRSPHLSFDQASKLGRRVLEQYQQRIGSMPKKMVMHKSSHYDANEQAGFAAAFREIPLLRLVTLAPSPVRLVTHGTYPPSRGTLVTINEGRNFLFTSGYLRQIATYPGPHIPAPIEINIAGDHSHGEIVEAAQQTLALGRLNWNTSDLRSSQPVTLGFARRVGGIMAEYGFDESSSPDPSYRYYM